MRGSRISSHASCPMPHAFLFGKDVTRSRRFLRHEDADELRLERAEVLEKAEELVVVALVEFLEVAEVLFEHFLAGVGIEDGDVDVEDEAGGLDEDLAVERAAV